LKLFYAQEMTQSFDVTGTYQLKVVESALGYRAVTAVAIKEVQVFVVI
jgi:hypothetical protein